MTHLVARDIERAADAVRSANHATMRSPITPPDAYDVVGGLADLARRVPQLVEFLTRAMSAAEPAEYFDDRGGETRLTLHVASTGLWCARHDLTELAFHLDQTHNALGHLGRHTPED
ncbi:hypothetical protein EV188_106244 [Actinomycetospora succinea]|uniref:Uncharacterized protein n=1 Tax=Actinomycetospora succinea TaxID=663603 RepID=A0A4R6V6K8_9PSEU|nr:hypothetical protein [Actinomycetospora succinea]TDQ54097.1 hypothetical protein EV188_106244 [Actinomycetospora succinea]